MNVKRSLSNLAKALKGHRKLRIISVLVVSFVFSIIMVGCSKNTIKIGYIADLSALTSQLGVDARNALLLRVDQINAQGGINGHPIEIIIKDEKGDAELASQLFDAFKNEKVKFVIGPLTSSMAVPALEAQSNELLIVSPSISGDLVTGLDDYFLRTCQLNTQQAKQLSDFMIENGIYEAQVAYTTTNRDYTETLAQSFKDYYESSGGTVTELFGYESDDDLEEVASKLTSNGSNVSLIVSHAMDTAIIQQHIKKNSPEHQSFGIQWSMTNDLIANGGKAVEGMYFVGNYSSEAFSDDYVDFTRSFYERYGYEATFITYWTYDAIEVLAYGLNEAKEETPDSVKAAILQKKDFEGIDQNFTIDAFGDSNKRYTIYKLTNGAFEKAK